VFLAALFTIARTGKQGKKRKKWEREKENVGTRTQTVGINKR